VIDIILSKLKGDADNPTSIGYHFRKVTTIPSIIVNNLFEVRNDIRDAGTPFEFSIDYSSDIATIESLRRWGNNVDDDGFFYSIAVQYGDVKNIFDFISLLVISYIYYKNMYEAMGIRDLTTYWTELTLEQRQGTRDVNADKMVDEFSGYAWVTRNVEVIPSHDDEPYNASDTGTFSTTTIPAIDDTEEKRWLLKRMQVFVNELLLYQSDRDDAVFVMNDGPGGLDYVNRVRNSKENIILRYSQLLKDADVYSSSDINIRDSINIVTQQYDNAFGIVQNQQQNYLPSNREYSHRNSIPYVIDNYRCLIKSFNEISINQ
jgi:hypothetical protein